MPEHTIYALIDPRKENVRYIGMTQERLQTRLYQHLNHLDGNLEKRAWIRELQSIGMTPSIKALEDNLTRTEAQVRETYWIKHYLSTNTSLLNISKVRVFNRNIDIRTHYNGAQ